MVIDLSTYRRHNFTPFVLGTAITGAVGFLSVARVTRYSLLPRLMLILYAMPFLVLLEYLRSGTVEYAGSVPLVHQLIDNSEVVAFISCLAFVGLSGLLFGFFVADISTRRGKADRTHASGQQKERCALAALGPGTVILAVGALVLLAWLAAPKATVLSASYTEIRSAKAQVEELAFSGLKYGIYAAMICLWLDAEVDASGRRLKTTLLVAGLALIIGVFDLLRGSRTSSGLLMSILALYLTAPNLKTGGASLVRQRLFWVATVGVAAFMLYFSLGSLRHSLSSGQTDWTLLKNGLLEAHKSGTWMGPLYSCFGLAQEHLAGGLEMLWGRTYLDYLLSTPPGPIASLLGLSRPIGAYSRHAPPVDLDISRLPGWWYMGYTVGGLHPIVVAFKNFGPLGAFFVPAVYGFAIAKVEIGAESGKYWDRLLYGAFFMAAFHWFWYSDMYIIRAVTTVLACGLVYRLAIAVTAGNAGQSAEARRVRPGPAFTPKARGRNDECR
ncbi:MAG: hypothetical protein JW751_29710 [Polyangiaceae bacterium]|nr:hypothetical protein [Polyangiaceae bacterium]